MVDQMSVVRRHLCQSDVFYITVCKAVRRVIEVAKDSHLVLSGPICLSEVYWMSTKYCSMFYIPSDDILQLQKRCFSKLRWYNLGLNSDNYATSIQKNDSQPMAKCMQGSSSRLCFHWGNDIYKDITWTSFPRCSAKVTPKVAVLPS